MRVAVLPLSTEGANYINILILYQCKYYDIGIFARYHYGLTSYLKIDFEVISSLKDIQNSLHWLSTVL